MQLPQSEEDAATEPAEDPNIAGSTVDDSVRDDDVGPSGAVGGNEGGGLDAAAYVGIAAAVIALGIGALVFLVCRSKQKKTAAKATEAAGGKRKDIQVDQLHYVRFSAAF